MHGRKKQRESEESEQGRDQNQGGYPEEVGGAGDERSKQAERRDAAREQPSDDEGYASHGYGSQRYGGKGFGEQESDNKDSEDSEDPRPEGGAKPPKGPGHPSPS